ncbi:unnamed protein product [Microthlaspi erraticum]|uniref:NB-ARC domain-containing protein n=1 Tax=Microthlaspi erraticum TaxID=1685480 RepID=A0A6D2KN18_9BRAS|nr:unnamed protein product [Microthlaspi erraticum]
MPQEHRGSEDSMEGSFDECSKSPWISFCDLDFENFVGIEDHISKMSELLDLESEEVKMIGIWGSSGIGKTTIARVLFSRLSRHFQGSIYIDRRFIAKSMELPQEQPG